jgi:hypothetical protein
MWGAMQPVSSNASVLLLEGTCAQVLLGWEHDRCQWTISMTDHNPGLEMQCDEFSVYSATVSEAFQQQCQGLLPRFQEAKKIGFPSVIML